MFCFQFKFYWFIHYSQNKKYLYALMSELEISLVFANIIVRNINNKIDLF